jgi:thiol-disulfide isomerase/thioredoxin
MRTFRACCVFALALLAPAVLALHAADKPAAGDVKVEAVKYDKLGDIIRNLKGKVVVVDFWGLLCPPCREHFPEFVELQKKYGKDGLAAVSVAIVMDEDQPRAEHDMQVLQFLKEKQAAATTNLILDEKAEFWSPKLHFNALPCVFVFNREGKWHQFKDGTPPGADYHEIEKLVVELLKEKEK